MRTDLLYFLPELVLAATIGLLFVVDFLKPRGKGLSPTVAFVGIATMMVVNVKVADLPSAHFFSGMVTFDPMGHFFQYLFGIAGLLTILFSQKSQELQSADLPSYFTLITAVVLGLMLLATSNNLLMLYLSLEMVSVLSYVLTGYLKGIRRSSEAALKYVIYGGVASGIMVYGISLLYGLTGTLSLPAIAEFLRMHSVDRSVLFLSVLLMMSGFFFKISAFPFQMWAPDVYEGAPTPITAFFSVGPKAAGFAILIRFFLTALSDHTAGGFIDLKSAGWPQVIGVLSIATMTIGNLAALQQTNMKRLLAYSSIAHAGYMLMGFAALNDEALRAIVFYLVVYLIMNLGAFLIVIIISNLLKAEYLDAYKGLGRRGGLGLWLALAMTAFMFSLTGIPPTAGFIGKFYLFSALIRANLYGLAIAGVLNSVVSLYYYVRVVKVMFFDEPVDNRPLAMPLLQHSCIVSGLAVLTIYLGLFWNRLAEVVARSSTLLF